MKIAAAMDTARRHAKRILRFADRAWPLSLFGTANLAMAVLMWIRSSAEENNEGLLFPICILVILFISIVVTRLWNAVPWVTQCSWERGEPFRQGENPRAFLVSAPSAHAPFPFIRVHFMVSGTLSSASCAAFRVARELRAFAGKTIEASMPLPASGVLTLRGGFLVRDALGLTRRPIGVPRFLEEAVLPATGPEFSIVEPDTNASSERNALSKKSEGEKIFIREYVPGDLARDINWKALARTGLLLTRVPPESPKETRVIRVVFLSPALPRDMRARGRALVCIDHLRTLASSFLLTVREFSPDYAFALSVGGIEYLADSTDSLDSLFIALARAGFSGDSDFPSADAVPEGAWVFASASDAASRSILPQCAAAGCQLILSVGPGGERRENGVRRDLSLFASVPSAVPLYSMLASLVPGPAPSGSGERFRLPGSACVEYFCGVRA